MKVSFVADKPQTSGTAILPVFKGGKTFGGAKAYVTASKGQFAKASKAAKFAGEGGKAFDLFVPNGSEIGRLRAVGAGDPKKFDAEMFAARVTKSLLMSGESTLTFHLGGLDLTPDDMARAAVGARLAAYRFDTYRTKLPASKKPSLKAVKIACDDPAKAKKSYANFHGPVCDGTVMARDLVNEPPNVIYPKAYELGSRKWKSSA